MQEQPRPRSRRGRIPDAELATRRSEVLDAALAELVAVGYERVTTEGIARRASASKQTLYRWFGDRAGIFTALIARNGDAVAATLDVERLEGDAASVLRTFARALLRLLLGPESVALNRAAMASPELAAALRAAGRGRVEPVMRAWLAERNRQGDLAVAAPAEAFTTLIGLVVADRQVRVLLGEEPPTEPERDACADRGVAQFLALHAGPAWDAPVRRADGSASMDP